ncbi:MAG: hypothetical protein WCJ42_11870, partial [Actinomycetes bacterium]
MTDEPIMKPETEVSRYCVKCSAEMWPDEYVCPMCAEVRLVLPANDPSQTVTQNYRFGKPKLPAVSGWRRFQGNGWVLFTGGAIAGAICATIAILSAGIANQTPDSKKVSSDAAAPSATVVSTATATVTATPSVTGTMTPGMSQTVTATP